MLDYTIEISKSIWMVISSPITAWILAGSFFIILILAGMLLSKLSNTVLQIKKALNKNAKETAATKLEYDKKSAEIEIITERRINETKMIADREVRAAGNRVRPFDVEKDMEFILYIIDTKVSQAIKYKLLPELRQSEKHRALLRDDGLEEISANIVADIMGSLSAVYINEAIGRYIIPSKVMNFIAETVFISLLSEVLAINDNQIKRIKNARNFQNIQEAAKEANRKIAEEEAVSKQS
jgi:hypothetical protein